MFYGVVLKFYNFYGFNTLVLRIYLQRLTNLSGNRYRVQEVMRKTEPFLKHQAHIFIPKVEDSSR